MIPFRPAVPFVLAAALAVLVSGCEPQQPYKPVEEIMAAANPGWKLSGNRSAAGEAPAAVPFGPPSIDRQTAETHLKLARALESAGDPAGALADYEAALAYDGWPATPGAEPAAGTPYAGLARLCEGNGPDAVISRACAGAVDLGRFPPKRLAGFLVRRGDANTRLGESVRAMSDYKAALAIDSGNREVRVSLGRLHETLGDDNAAMREYGLALLRWPDSAAALLARGRLRARLGDAPGAMADFDAVLSNPATVDADPAAYRDRAMAHCRIGQPEAAAVDWQVWIGLDSGAASATRQMLESRGYLAAQEQPGFGPEAQQALSAWIGGGCPEE